MKLTKSEKRVKNLFQNHPDTAYSLAIVIPCYNEYNRLPMAQYKHFLDQSKSTCLVFSNDGSTDQTADQLNELQRYATHQVFIYTLERNKGKAQAVREAILDLYQQPFTFKKVAYLDADLSTSLEECKAISKKIKKETLFAFGSRILKLDTNIHRKFFRFLVGRVIATLISRQLHLSVYDSQCGCKVFSASIAQQVFQEVFISRWLFDVEIFHRLIHYYGLDAISHFSKEVPLTAWIDTDESKVRLTYFFKMWYDLFMISKKYNGLFKVKSPSSQAQFLFSPYHSTHSIKATSK